MCGLKELLAFETFNHVVVVGTHFLLLGSFGDEERAYLLVAILAELLLIAGECIEVVVKGCKHFELVIDEELGILLDVLLVDDAFGVVLVEVVFKLAASDWRAVDAHDDGVFLCGSGQGDCCQG